MSLRDVFPNFNVILFPVLTIFSPLFLHQVSRCYAWRSGENYVLDKIMVFHFSAFVIVTNSIQRETR